MLPHGGGRSHTVSGQIFESLRAKLLSRFHLVSAQHTDAYPLCAARSSSRSPLHSISGNSTPKGKNNPESDPTSRQSSDVTQHDTGEEQEHISNMSLTNCRFYEEKYPEVESFVMVNVKQIAEMGAYVKLLEYGGFRIVRRHG